jgi:hypothetical protein
MHFPISVLAHKVALYKASFSPPIICRISITFAFYEPKIDREKAQKANRATLVSFSAKDNRPIPIDLAPDPLYTLDQGVFHIAERIYGTGMILLANPDSHFFLQKPINIMEGFLHRCRRLLP